MTSPTSCCHLGKRPACSASAPERSLSWKGAVYFSPFGRPVATVVTSLTRCSSCCIAEPRAERSGFTRGTQICGEERVLDRVVLCRLVHPE
jgi:hypothetical protein